VISIIIKTLSKMSDTDDLTEMQTNTVTEDKYDFDYHALLKLKKKQKSRTVCFSSLVLLLTLFLILFVALYFNCSKREQRKTTITTIRAARIQAYKRIAKYGEDCSKDFTCGKYAFCRNYQGSHRCDCQHGYYGDGIGDCKDGYFGINFVTPTLNNIPVVKNVAFPESEALSVCFWFNLQGDIKEHMAMFNYISHLVKGESSFMIWLSKENNILVSFKGKQFNLHPVKTTGIIQKNQWTHLCWVWHFQKSWKLYLNGKLHNEEKSLFEMNEKFPASDGSILLGQDIHNGHVNDTDHMFKGQITEFFIYSRELTAQDVISAYQNVPPTQDNVLGWWQFKNSTKGNEIVKIEYPFIHKYFKSKRR